VNDKNRFKEIWESIRKNVTVMQLSMISPVLRYVLKVHVKVPLLLKSEKIKLITWNAVALIFPEDFPRKEMFEKEISKTIRKTYKRMGDNFINDLRFRGSVKSKKILNTKYFDENGKEYDRIKEDEDRFWDDKIGGYNPPLRVLAKTITTYEECEYFIDYNRLNEITPEVDYKNLKENIESSQIKLLLLIEEYTNKRD
jgi:hypothetical protein